MLGGFRAAHPEVVVAVDTLHRDLDVGRRGYDVRIAYVDDRCAATARDAETLFKESLLPVCSPRLLSERRAPDGPTDLCGWPLVYRVRGDVDWRYWTARNDLPPPVAHGAWGFGLYSMVVQAAVAGIGAAIGHATLLKAELARGSLVPLFDRATDAALRCCLFTSASARRDGAVSRLREWLLADVAAAVP